MKLFSAQKLLLNLTFLTLLLTPVLAEDNDPNTVFENDAVRIWYQLQHEKLTSDSNSAVAVHFETGKKWHFYSDPETAPAPNLYLNFDIANDHGLQFDDAILPKAKDYFDKTQNKNVKVYGGNFTVFIPFKMTKKSTAKSDKAVIEVTGAYCSDVQCRVLNDVQFSFTPNLADKKSQPEFKLPEKTPVEKNDDDNATVQGGFGIVTLSKFALAVITGLLFNVMPCVLPVIPLIITRLLKQSEQSKARSLELGAIFCVGIISFFALIAVINIILKIGFGTVLQWGDYFRYPWFIQGMSLLLIVLGLFMFGVFSIGIPSSVTGKASSGEGAAGSFGMGFLAALLSTPCSFGILAGVVAWAQTQNLMISTMVFLLMGIGMAVPYAILISFPSLLQKIPKPGEWMEKIKITMGVILIIIAIKLFEALPPEKLIMTLYYAVVLGFALWMWGSWVTYKTKKVKKYSIRLLAVLLAVFGGIYLLGGIEKSAIDWKDYDNAEIQQAIENDRPVLIKFTASWCATCKVVDKNVYQDSGIADLIEQKNILPVKGDTTTADMPATDALKNLYNEPGVPVTIVHLPGKDKPVKLRGLMSKTDLTDLLEKIK